MHRRELLHFFARGECGLFTIRKLFGGSDDNDIVLTPFVQSLGAQHDVEGLIPRHILQPQGQIARHRVADHDVLTAGIGEQLQHRTDIDVLEIQG